MIDTITPYLPHAACLFVGALVGVGSMAALTMSKVADAGDADEAKAAAEHWYESYHNVLTAHCRCGDALGTARNRIERALAVETPKAAHGVKKMAAILRGDV